MSAEDYFNITNHILPEEREDVMSPSLLTTGTLTSFRTNFVVPSDFCGDGLKSFARSYRSVHCYISLIICLFGAQANVLNLIVLTRKEMVNPTNVILTGLALADLLNMLEYIPYAVYMILSRSLIWKTSYAWALFVLIHSNFSQVCHTISIWLTVTLAVWRYIMVAMHVRSRTLCSMNRAVWAVASAYVISPLLCIPIYLTFSMSRLISTASSTSTGNLSSLSTTTITAGDNISVIEADDFLFQDESSFLVTPIPTNSSSKYVVNLSELAKTSPILLTANFWLYSVVVKIIPCIVLTVVSIRLINSLMEAKRRKHMLLKKSTILPVINHLARVSQAGAGTLSSFEQVTQQQNVVSNQQESAGSDRTTKMLLAVLLLFLLTEFPQGLLALLSGVLGDAFFTSCYIPLADLMDFGALLNSAINFILYCAMSKKFRDTFSQVFRLESVTMKWRSREIGSRVHDAYQD